MPPPALARTQREKLNHKFTRSNTKCILPTVVLCDSWFSALNSLREGESLRQVPIGNWQSAIANPLWPATANFGPGHLNVGLTLDFGLWLNLAQQPEPL